MADAVLASGPSGRPSARTIELVSAVRRGDDRAFEELYARYQRRIAAYVLRDGPRPRPRRGHHAGGLRLRAAPHARDRAADRVQAVDLRDRQERLHRRLPARAPRRGGLVRRRRPALAADHGRLVASRPRARRGRRHQAGARPPLRRVRRALRDPPRDPRHARARGAQLPRDRRAHGHEPPRRREHAVPRAQAPGRGVRRARLGRALPARAGDHRRRSGARLGARDRRKLARHVSHCQPCRRARRARRPRRRRARAPRACAEKIAGLLPLPAFLRWRRGGEDATTAVRRRRHVDGARADARRLDELRLEQGRGRARCARCSPARASARRPCGCPRSATSGAPATGRPTRGPRTTAAQARPPRPARGPARSSNAP